MNFTLAQTQAICSRGNTLVIAGAGTGKTRTLVQRCVERLLDPGEKISFDSVLMVTFTEAAAAEMRDRIRGSLEHELKQQPHNARLTEQLALLDTAHICTLHSFCLRLVRDHFYELELDPQLTVLPDEPSRLLASETLDALLRERYAGADAESEAVRCLIQDQARGWERAVRDWVLQLHDYTQTRADPEGWFRQELQKYESPAPTGWQSWLLEGLGEWRRLVLPLLQSQSGSNPNAQQCATILEQLSDDPSRVAGARALEEILQVDEHWPPKKKTALRKPLKGFFEEAAFLHSLFKVDAADPLMEDWEWVRPGMLTLLALARQFSHRFSAAKRELGVVDFHDLEQFALKLLWDFAADQPTSLAQQWQDRLELVCVDEYQDINAAQDKILTALSRSGAQANRFLVGDVKQSIYRFRQADPSIFQRYASRWREDSTLGQAIYLSDNFRSHEALLQFINPLFAALMRQELGGVPYNAQAALQFGAPETRRALTMATDPGPRVEVHLRLKDKADATEPDEDAAISYLAELSDAEKEARMAGLRLRELYDSRWQVWDAERQTRRPVEWKDMVVLLRSPRFKVESFAKEFTRLEIPLQAKRSGFFESTEVLDLVHLLMLLDNPLQDVPALAVLHSPLVGLSSEELARIRLAAPKTRYWTALLRWHNVWRTRFKGASPETLYARSRPSSSSSSSEQSKHSETESEHEGEGRGQLGPKNDVEVAPNLAGSPGACAETFAKVDDFLQRFRRWRTLARRASLAQRLEMVLNETYYLDWLLTQPRGEQRQANVQQLLTVARQFDELNRQGLYQFLQLIEAQREAAGDREPAPLEIGNAVRLMSIHQSKGLEFPVVVVADLGKRFNLSDAKGGLVLDEKYGLCPQVHPPELGQHYPSLPYWLAQRNRRRETLGEELRLLYVALTRAQDALLLTGTATAHAAANWPDKAVSSPPVLQLLQANHYLDWLGPWLTYQTQEEHTLQSVSAPLWIEKKQGQGRLWHWRIYRDEDLREPPVEPPPVPSEGSARGARPSWAAASSERRPATAALNAIVGSSVAAPGGGRAPPARNEGEGRQAIEPGVFQDLLARLRWTYPFAASTREPAKASVTALRRRFTEEADEEARRAAFLPSRAFARPATGTGQLTAAEIGTAHHRFLECVTLDKLETLADLEEEARRLCQAKILTREETHALNLAGLHQFWQSELGRKFRGKAEFLRRELPFTLRLTSDDLVGLEKVLPEALPPSEFVVVQGQVDLALFLEEGIWLLDFKTDLITEQQLPEKVGHYAPQLKLYGLALNRIYHRPVTERWLHFLSLGRTVAA